jgi:hypothetical protein
VSLLCHFPHPPRAPRGIFKNKEKGIRSKNTKHSTYLNVMFDIQNSPTKFTVTFGSKTVKAPILKLQ